MTMNPPRILAIIPARGGSKGVPRKNIRNAGGRPLIAWTIEAARQSRYISRLILSSDDPEIIETARQLGCEVPFVRPASLADDTASAMDVVKHAVSEIPGYDYLLLLQPTSPLRTAADIDNAVELMLTLDAPSCVGITETSESPYWMMISDENDQIKPLIDCTALRQRRQDLPKTYLINGAIYIASVNWLMQHSSFIGPQTVGYRMPRDRSVDIDTQEDFLFFLSSISDTQHNSPHKNESMEAGF
jgi:CMP-N,N'-diacetyllegionaminic acid synthase